MHMMIKPSLIINPVFSMRCKVFPFFTMHQIAQCKAHISELNLHAEAQATEYKEKVGQDLNCILFSSVYKFVN